MVVVTERQEVPAIAADEPQPARHLVELVEVEREVEDVVLELVGERPDAPMADLAVQEVRLHARPLLATGRSGAASAASKPERQPSSWKP